MNARLIPHLLNKRDSVLKIKEILKIVLYSKYNKTTY